MWPPQKRGSHQCKKNVNQPAETVLIASATTQHAF
jgi:hypothetical protein